MSNMPELKIGVVAVSRDCFPESLSVNRRKALIDAYTKKYGEGTVIKCEKAGTKVMLMVAFDGEGIKLFDIKKDKRIKRA